MRNVSSSSKQKSLSLRHKEPTATMWKSDIALATSLWRHRSGDIALATSLWPTSLWRHRSGNIVLENMPHRSQTQWKCIGFLAWPAQNLTIAFPRSSSKADSFALLMWRKCTFSSALSCQKVTFYFVPRTCPIAPKHTSPSLPNILLWQNLLQNTYLTQRKAATSSFGAQELQRIVNRKVFEKSR